MSGVQSSTSLCEDRSEVARVEMQDLSTVNSCTYSNAATELRKDSYFLERNLADNENHFSVMTPFEEIGLHISVDNLGDQQFIFRLLLDSHVFVSTLIGITMPKRVNLLETSSDEDDSLPSNNNMSGPSKGQEYSIPYRLSYTCLESDGILQTLREFASFIENERKVYLKEADTVMAMDHITRTINMEEKFSGMRGHFIILRDICTKVAAAVNGLLQNDHRLLNLVKEKEEKTEKALAEIRIAMDEMRELIEESKPSPKKRGRPPKTDKFVPPMLNSARYPTMAGHSTDYSRLYFDQYAHLMSQ